MNFGELKSEVSAYLLELPSETIPRIGGWLNEAQRKAAERHNFRFMDSTLSADTVAGNRFLANKDPQWKEAGSPPFFMRQDGSTKEIAWAPSETEMLRMFAPDLPQEGNQSPPDTGRPRFILERLTDLQVFPFPDGRSGWNDGEYRLHMPFWKYPEPLVNDGDENWFTRNMAYYLVFYAAGEGFLFNENDTRAQIYMGKAEAEFQSGRRTDKLSKLPDRVTLYPKRDVYGTLRSRRL